LVKKVKDKPHSNDIPGIIENEKSWIRVARAIFISIKAIL
jgi:hypothetical protein